ncbi:fimbria/pilus periplasmic chaperone [Pseudomonas protegens]|uniref:fimbria/pilus periplasmic chaperone n=1 Tax=Pseudomonas protegens TaxID=380021 RepID=UPI002936D74F|nr:fimbria/pilus periplasmic chaperone [Pseudomonas protegens]WOE77950.1 fimbria/pilus periplasmic chaperone [Pseudomonas protegens]
MSIELMPLRTLSRLVCVCACLLLPMSATASVVVDSTRLIYPAFEREISLRLSNSGSQPALVQAWIDDGNVDAKPDDVDVPFVVTPPIARINQDKGQSLRIAHTPGAEIPKDRESVFWLNVLDVPPLPSEQANNHMQMAFRTRLKLFFRPANLPGSPVESAENLQWSLAKSGSSSVLKVRNDGAFYVSFSSVEIKLKDGRSFEVQSHMLAPKSTTDFALDQALTSSAIDGRVIYQWINDYGTTVRGEKKLHF